MYLKRINNYKLFPGLFFKTKLIQFFSVEFKYNIYKYMTIYIPIYIYFVASYLLISFHQIIKKINFINLV